MLDPPRFVPPLADIAQHSKRLAVSGHSKAMMAAFPQAVISILHRRTLS